MPEKVLHIDIETRSDIDLSKAGVYPYSEYNNFDILIVAAAIDDDEIACFDLASGDTLPEWFTKALADPDYIKVAHHAAFERVCFSRFFNGRHSYTFLDPSQWHCTMVHAAMLGLPFSLDGVAKVLGTGEQKDKAGTDLIKYFCVPCKPTESNGGRTWNNPADAPEKWESFKSYCIQDVATERDIYYRLQRFPIPESERLVYILDQQINDRGVLIDLQMVEQAIKCDLLHSEILTRRAYELTSLENPNSVSQLKMWLEERGLTMDTLGKKQVAAQIRELDKNGCDAELLEMLKLRLQMAKSSVKKYQAVERAVSADGRARGLFKDYGANHTGRWCLGEGSRILVKDKDGHVSEKPIEDVLLSDRVFDGENWVTHEGVVFSGDKDVITWDGIIATPEHMVFIDDTTKIPLSEAAEKKIPLWRGSRKVYSVYKVTLPSGRIYVGYTGMKIQERWRHHIVRAASGVCPNHPFYTELSRSNPADCKLETICIGINRKAIMAREQEEIAKVPHELSLNLSPGGELDAQFGGHVFWERLNADPERRKAYLKKLSDTKLQNDWTDYEALSAAARKWQQENPRKAYKNSYRSIRLARRAEGYPPGYVPIKDNRPRKERLMCKYKINEVRRRNTARAWAKKSDIEKSEILGKISAAAKKRFEDMQPDDRREVTAKARAAIDRKKQGPAASAGIKKFWVDLKADPERYEAYMTARTASLMKTIGEKKNAHI